jgi:hypothetical protein
MGQGTYTKKSGRTQMGVFQKGALSTIKMVTHSIMNWLILYLNQKPIIPLSIVNNTNTILTTWQGFNHSLKNGMLLKRVENGIVNMVLNVGRIEKWLQRFALVVASNLRTSLYGLPQDFVLIPASLNTEGIKEQTMSSDCVFSVVSNSQRTNITRQLHAHTVVQVNGVKVESKKQPVYNLTVDTVHEYFVNGVLVSNCDSTRYAMLGLTERFGFATAKPGKSKVWSY